MGTNSQIVIVGTGFHGNGQLSDYYASVFYNYDHPAYVIMRDGSLERTPSGYGHTVAIENVGPVVQQGTLWLPAKRSREGRFEPITTDTDKAVRVPYEYCSCKPYHGCQHYEYIRTKQLATLREVIASWLSESGIRYPYDNQLGEICPRAVAGKSGIYFASSFDKSRSDIHPQKEIIDIIKAYAS